MRCLVLGAGGFIGTNLCRALVAQGCFVRAFGRRQSFPELLTGCHWISGNFSDPTSLATAIQGCDVVFHLINATTPASANLDKVADLEANVVSTLRFLEICRETNIKRVVFASSGGTIYGVPNLIPTPETAPTHPITAYGISKLAIEKYLSLYEYLYSLDYRVLRLANPFGPYQTTLKNQGVVAAFVHRALSGAPVEMWGDGSVIRDYVYIDDVVDAFVSAAFHKGSNRVFNIGSGEGRSLNDIVAAISRLLGCEVNVYRRAGRSVDVPVSVLDTELAISDLHWVPRIKFDDGLRRTIEWMKSAGV